jgi:OOP family OmpA-OmpF porin
MTAMKYSRNLKMLVGLALPLTIAACSQGGYMGMPYELNSLKTTPPTGSAFTQDLSKDYLPMAEGQRDEYNWPIMSLFAHKGLQAAQGVAVGPERVDDWSYAPLQLHGVNGTFFHPDPQAAVPLNEAYGRLVAMLATDASARFPEWAATAQTKYDCWLVATHGALDADLAISCRKGFEDAMTAIKGQNMAATTPAPAPTPAAIVAGGYQVFFDFDKSNISAEAHATLVTVAAKAQKQNVTHVSLTGHTDTVGTETYNMALSLRRADAVKAVLISLGVPADEISVVGKGKMEPLIQTGDDVREPKNRRVEIVLPQ